VYEQKQRQIVLFQDFFAALTAAWHTKKRKNTDKTNHPLCGSVMIVLILLLTR